MNDIFSFLGIDRDEIKTPSQLYRVMRPEYFSDSVNEKERVSREQFKYILSRVSTDQRQDAFEELTRRCVIKLITPNIIPQTGPTGGGDAKADLLSFPVSKITSSFFIITECINGNEKWAFAISSVQKWSAKMDSDIKKIIETYPDTERVYFCTNQSVSARNRLSKQQKFKETYGIDIFILDLSWYIQAVYDQGCYDDAIEALGLGDDLKLVKKLGPNDTAREKELQELDKIVPKTLANGFDDCYVSILIGAAKLSRELERPKIEVYGRFAVALEASKKYGFSQQVFECIYQIAWTEFYWYEDADATYEKYCELKKLFEDEINVVRIEKLFTLFQALYTAHAIGMFKKDVDVENECTFFKDLYSQLKENPDRPSCLLYLRICLLEFELMYQSPKSTYYNENKIKDIIIELIDKLKQATTHIDIPFESQVDILMIIGNLYENNRHFDELVDIVTDIQSSRNKDISAATIQYQRGIQNLENKNFTDAIRHLSRSFILYHKEDTYTELVRTSVALAFAYYNVDLLYSSKVYYIKALSLLLISIGNKGESNHLFITILFSLCEIELGLGQLSTFLEWLMYLDGYVSVLPNYLDEDFISNRTRLDALLGSLIYESPMDDDIYVVLPDILERHQLEFSRNILLLKMDKRDLVAEQFQFMVEGETYVKKFVSQILDKAKSLFPLTINHDKKGVLKTLVHGCTIRVRYADVTYEQTFSEMILACMELVMQSLITKSMPSTPIVDFYINCVNEGETKVVQKSVSECKIIINKNTFTSQNDIWELLVKVIAQMLLGSVLVKDIEEFLEERQKDDFLMQRLSSLTSYLNDIKNIIPHYRNAFIESFAKPDDEHYTFKKTSSSKEQNKSNKQADAIITSLIDTRLWDAAKWHGCGYIIPYDFSEPSIMVLLYDNIASGIKIFEKWEEDYRNDKLNLKIVIITGIDANHPNWYKVLLTPDVKTLMSSQKNKKERYVVSTSRFHLMTPITNENLIRLKQSYETFKFIGLSASTIVDNQMSFDVDKRYNKVIPIRNVVFREAWTIGLNEPESVAILSSDEVIIPSTHSNDAPVLEVISRKR